MAKKRFKKVVEWKKIDDNPAFIVMCILLGLIGLIALIITNISKYGLAMIFFTVFGLLMLLFHYLVNYSRQVTYEEV